MAEQELQKYVDTGSLALFARQILEQLPGAVSVAVIDRRRQIVWCGPDEDDRRHWPREPFVTTPLSRNDACVALGDRGCAYLFALRGPDKKKIPGLLCVLVAGAPGDIASVRRDLAPILACVDKQLEIRLELSAVQRLSARERNGLSVLLKLDELMGDSTQADCLESALELAADHFDCDAAAIFVPGNRIRRLWKDEEMGAGELDALTPMLARLYAATRERRKVLLTDLDPAPVRGRGKRGKSKRILCSPILDEHDSVTGIMAVIGSTRFERSDMRFARVLAGRLGTFIEGNRQDANVILDRHALLQHIDQSLSGRGDQLSALLLVDIDKLHVVNEAHGHLAGDAAVRRVREIASTALLDGDRLGDLGSGALAIYLHRSDEEEALRRARQLCTTLETTAVSFEDRSIELTASVGLVLIPEIAADASAAINTAEVAVRSAKARGGNQCVVFRDADASVMRRRADLDQVGVLQAALLDNRFVLYGQEIRALSGETDMPRYEILVRMLDEKQRLVSPERFLSSAERYQMMSALDRWVVRNAMETLSRADNPLEVGLSSFSINVSAQTILDHDFLEFVESQIMQSGISPDTFCFEVTETAVMRRVAQAQQFLAGLRKLGCRIALDDFGTGHCSFAYLKDLSVHYIKIDGMFVRDIVTNPLSEAIVESVSRIAGVLNARTVAEHVENDLVVSKLRRAGIHFGQGYRIAKPRPLADILSALTSPLSGESFERKAMLR